MDTQKLHKVFTVWENMKWWQKIFFFPMFDIVLTSAIISKSEKEKKNEEELEKATLRNFKVEVKSGLLWNDVKLIQREKPLTDEEMELMYKEYKS